LCAGSELENTISELETEQFNTNQVPQPIDLAKLNSNREAIETNFPMADGQDMKHLLLQLRRSKELNVKLAAQAVLDKQNYDQEISRLKSRLKDFKEKLCNVLEVDESPVVAGSTNDLTATPVLPPIQKGVLQSPLVQRKGNVPTSISSLPVPILEAPKEKKGIIHASSRAAKVIIKATSIAPQKQISKTNYVRSIGREPKLTHSFKRISSAPQFPSIKLEKLPILPPLLLKAEMTQSNSSTPEEQRMRVASSKLHGNSHK
jgi:hypothetical protein